MKELQYLSCEERLREVRLFSLRKGQEDFINVYKDLTGGNKEERAGLNSQCPPTGQEA